MQSAVLSDYEIDRVSLQRHQESDVRLVIVTFDGTELLYEFFYWWLRQVTQPLKFLEFAKGN